MDGGSVDLDESLFFQGGLTHSPGDPDGWIHAFYVA